MRYLLHLAVATILLSPFQAEASIQTAYFITTYNVEDASNGVTMGDATLTGSFNFDSTVMTHQAVILAELAFDPGTTGINSNGLSFSTTDHSAQYLAPAEWLLFSVAPLDTAGLSYPYVATETESAISVSVGDDTEHEYPGETYIIDPEESDPMSTPEPSACLTWIVLSLFTCSVYAKVRR
ncbi:MAG: hypothetical protein P8N76_18585 [Pirellulaceae bacterium]|nr:hypothetical protein [Pirellulaceae bacterium]